MQEEIIEKYLQINETWTVFASSCSSPWTYIYCLGCQPQPALTLNAECITRARFYIVNGCILSLLHETRLGPYVDGSRPPREGRNLDPRGPLGGPCLPPPQVGGLAQDRQPNTRNGALRFGFPLEISFHKSEEKARKAYY